MDVYNMLKNWLYTIARRYNLDVRGIYYYSLYFIFRTFNMFEYPKDERDIFGTIEVDPANINLRRKTGTIHKWKDMGKILPGDWDTSAESVFSSTGFSSTFIHFKYGVPWDETPIYRRALASVRSGGTDWQSCSTKEDIEARSRYLDKLYRDIKQDGFKSQSEIFGTSAKELLLSRDFRGSRTDVAVSVGRNGELILVDGHHRLAIARALGLDRIPVRIVTRHAKWENLREKIRNAESIEDLDEQALRHFGHPDIRESTSSSI